MGLGHSPTIITDGLVFSLDAANPRCYIGTGTSTLALVSGMGGTLYNGVGFTSSNSGSFVFDGTNDILKFTGVDIFGSVYTQCGWVRMNLPNNISLLVDGGYAGTVIGSGRIDFYYKDTPPYFMRANATFSSSQWSYVCSVRGATQKQIYFDTNLIATVNDSDSYICPYDYIQIGSNQGTDNLNGNISQIQIYNRALSATEIKQNYNATKRRYGL